VTPVDLVLKLLGQGFTIKADGDDLRCRGPRVALTPDLLGALKSYKAEILAMASGDLKPCPSLLGICKSWRRVTGGTVPEFLVTLHQVTGCNFGERNPEWIELYAFAAYLRGRIAGTHDDGGLIEVAGVHESALCRGAPEPSADAAARGLGAEEGGISDVATE